MCHLIGMGRESKGVKAGTKEIKKMANELTYSSLIKLFFKKEKEKI